MADVDAQQTQSSCKIEFISIRKADRIKYLILFTAIYAFNREFPTLEMNVPCKCQPHKMVKRIQTMGRQLPTNYLSVFDHFMEFALKEFTHLNFKKTVFHKFHFVHS